MSGATSILYAAKRCAEAVGADSEFEWHLVPIQGKRINWKTLIPQDDIAADYDGYKVVLTQVAEEQ